MLEQLIHLLTPIEVITTKTQQKTGYSHSFMRVHDAFSYSIVPPLYLAVRYLLISILCIICSGVICKEKSFGTFSWYELECQKFA
jgi:hypothetical protein